MLFSIYNALSHAETKSTAHVCLARSLLQESRHNTLQDTTRHCKTLQDTATYCNRINCQPIGVLSCLFCTRALQNTLYNTATHCNTLRHITTNYSALQKEPTAYQCLTRYGVASIGWLLKIIGLFCKRVLYERRYSAKETYNFKEPIYRSHPIGLKVLRYRFITQHNTLQHTATCQSASISIHNTT